MAYKERVIYHADMNAYFASVEELFHPELREVPMAICGDPESRRGIILAKNERAKAFGVKTAETIWQARRKCPDLVLRPARRDQYDIYCRRANAIYGQYTDLLEPASIDESFLDVTGSLHIFGGDAVALAHTIRRRIHEELGLTISVGVSYNKIFAKMGSDLQKPNAVTVITRENFRDLLWPLPVGQLLMVGKTTEATLHAMRIRTVGDLAQWDLYSLRRRLGRLGEHLHANANGLDDAPVASVDEVQPAQSIGNGITFKRDLVTQADIATAIHALCDTVGTRLRREGVKCRSVQVMVKDPTFRVITRQRALPVPTHLTADLVDACLSLLGEHWPEGKPIRLLAVTGMKLVDRDAAFEQVTLLAPVTDEARRKRERLEQAVDSIRRRFGEGSILAASIAANDLGIHEAHSGEEVGEEEEAGR